MNKIYIFFSNHLLIYETKTLILCNNFTFGNFSVKDQAIDLFHETLVFGKGNKVYFYNITKFNSNSHSLPTPYKTIDTEIYNLVSIKFDGKSIFICTNISLHQYPFSGHRRSHIWSYPSSAYNKTQFNNIHLGPNRSLILSSIFIQKTFFFFNTIIVIYVIKDIILV